MVAMRRGVGAAALAVVVVLGACKDNGGPQAPPPTASIGVAAAGAVDVLPGGSASLGVNVTRSGNYAGAITVTAEGLPAGVTVAPASIPAGANSGTLNVSASAAAAVGSAPITLRATGNGVSDATTSLTINVPQPPGIQASLTPAAATLAQGGSTVITVNVARQGGFTGAVALTAEGLPTGVTAQAGSVAAGASSGTITLTAAGNAALGSTPVTIRAAGTGITSRTASLALTVTAPPSFAMTLTPPALTVAQGGNGSFTVTVTRAGGFTGAVSVAAENLPAGVTLAGATIAAGEASALLTVSAAASAATGLASVVIRGTGADVGPQTGALALTIAPPPGIQVALNPTSLSIAQGGSGNVTVNVTRVGGFAGAVTLTAENLATGVTVANATIAEGAGSAAMTVNVAAGTAVGASSVVIRATGAGIPAQTAQLALTVTQAPGFTLAADPVALGITAGQQGQSTVTITRVGGFTGNVALSASGAPNGMSVAFNPASVSGTTAVATVIVGAGVGAGSYPITVSASGTGVTAQQVVLNVTVAAAGGPVTFQFCEADGVPVWLAVQDGDGAWQRVTGDAQHRYTFQMSSSRGAVAYVWSHEPGGFSTVVYYMTRQELVLQGEEECTTAPGATRTLTTTFTGLGAQWTHTMVNNVTFRTRDQTRSVSGVGPGPFDLMAVRSTEFLGAANRMVLLRGINPPGGDIVNVDFTGGSSFAPVVRNRSWSGAAGHTIWSTAYYVAAGNSGTALAYEQIQGSQQYRGVPADRQLPGDLHVLISAAEPLAADPRAWRYTGTSFRVASDRALEFGPAIGAVTVEPIASNPYYRARLTYTVQPEYSRFFRGGFGQDDAKRVVQVWKSAAYNQNAPTVVTEVPNFSGTAGWQNTWGMQGGATTWWEFSALHLSTDTFQTMWSEGSTWREGYRWNYIPG